MILRKYLAWAFVIGAFMVFVPCVGQGFAAEGDKTATGVIAKTGFGKIILKIGGKEVQFNTGRETKYKPSDFRPRGGDKVKVTYYDKDHRGSTIQAVKNLELIKANPNFKEPSNPTNGTIKEAGRRALNIYIPEIKNSWKFEYVRGWKAIPKGWKPAVDDKVKVNYKKVPSRFTGAIVYQIKSLEKLD